MSKQDTVSLDPSYQPIEAMATAGIFHAAEGLSAMIGKRVIVEKSAIRSVPLSQITTILGSPENAAVGVYLRVKGEYPGRILLVLPHADALGLVDLLMDIPSGTTHRLDAIEKSALSEVGNLAATAFLNKLAELMDLTAYPSPPAIMVDMVGALLEVIATSAGSAGDQVLMFQAIFACDTQSARVEFFAIPDHRPPQALRER